MRQSQSVIAFFAIYGQSFGSIFIKASLSMLPAAVGSLDRVDLTPGENPDKRCKRLDGFLFLPDFFKWMPFPAAIGMQVREMKMHKESNGFLFMKILSVSYIEIYI